MNIQILSASIVSRVHHSPDSVTNLEEVVRNLIQSEIDRSANLIAEKLESETRRLERVERIMRSIED